MKKIRIISLLLTIVMALSVLSASIVTASALDTVQNAASGVSSSFLKKIFKKTAANGISSILAKVGEKEAKDLLNKSGITLFDSFLEDDNEQVLSSITELNQKLDEYHKSEMDAITKLSDTVNKLYDNQILEPFKTDYTHMEARFKNLIAAIDSAKAQASDVTFESGVIDDNTYQAYHNVVSDSTLSVSQMSDDLSLMASYISESALNLDHKNAYDLLIEADKHNYDTQSFSYSQTVENAPNLNNSRESIDEIETELAVDYAAYATYLQMSCQCAIYESNRTDSAIDSILYYYSNPTGGKLTLLAQEMEAVQAGYESANEYFDSRIAATVTYGEGYYSGGFFGDQGYPVFNSCDTAYYPSAPRAWASASRTAATLGYPVVEMKLTRDWAVTSGQSIRGDLPDPCTWRSEKVQWSGMGYVTRYYLNSNDISFFVAHNQSDADCLAYFPAEGVKNDVVVDVNGHNLQLNHSMYNPGILLVTGNSTANQHAHIIDSAGSGQLDGFPYEDYVNSKSPGTLIYNAVIGVYRDFNMF
ncbi:MAG: hypothetical protein IJH32_11060 [Ruminococcus sp.]|nr:hypothetical protein [Ruminococcus sp.]